MNQRLFNRRLRRRAFTLIEIIVVVTIIGILALLIVPRLFHRISSAKHGVARTNLQTLEAQVLAFQIDTGRLPAALRELVEQPSDLEAGKWQGPYVKEKDLTDPWGEPYKYRAPGGRGQDFELASFGADKSEGGEGENADVLTE